MVQLTICQHWLMLQNFVFGGMACSFLVPQNTIIIVRCHFNTASFLSNTHKRHPVARPSFVSSKSDLCSVTHYNDVIMGEMASQITSLTIVYSTVYSGTDHQRKHHGNCSQDILVWIKQHLTLYGNWSLIHRSWWSGLVKTWFASCITKKNVTKTGGHI